jgi:hypothetical protein
MAEISSLTSQIHSLEYWVNIWNTARLWLTATTAVVGVFTFAAYYMASHYSDRLAHARKIETTLKEEQRQEESEKARQAIESARAISAKANERTAELSVTVERESLKRFEAEQKTRVLEKAASDARAAQLRIETDLAKQRERAAIAERSLLEAQERLRPRRLSTTQHAELVSLLRQAPKGAFDIQYLAGNLESQNFADELRKPLMEAGWILRSTRSTTDASATTGLRIIVKDNNLPPRAVMLQKALRSIGFPAAIWISPNSEEDFVMLYVGIKP